MNKIYKIVLVSWNDAYFDFNPDDPTETTILKGFSLGYLLKKDKTQVLIAAELFENGDLRQITAIPTACVKKITLLKTLRIS